MRPLSVEFVGDTRERNGITVHRARAWDYKMQATSRESLREAEARLMESMRGLPDSYYLEPRAKRPLLQKVKLALVFLRVPWSEGSFTS